METQHKDRLRDGLVLPSLVASLDLGYFDPGVATAGK